MKLLDHFKVMQDMFTRYLTPEPYVDRDGDVYVKETQRKEAIVSDLIYMFDGPEQRAAEKEAVEVDEFNLEWRMDIRKQVEQVDAIAAAANERAKVVAGQLDIANAEINDLRARLYEAELDAERMRGYMDAVEDSKPDVMVPAPRDRHFGRYNSRGQEPIEGWTMGRQERPKRWFQR